VKNFSRFLFAFIIFTIIWMLFTFPFNMSEFYAGMTVSFFVALFFGRYFSENGLVNLNPVRIFAFLIYIPFLLWEIVKANIEVAIIVLSPTLPIEPAIVKAKTSLKSNVGKLWLANSITLTPGTLTVDIVDDNYFIHCIKVKDTSVESSTKNITGKFEKLLRWFVK
jgi:multicomponent Na+:H+ antiporter subunit E